MITFADLAEPLPGAERSVDRQLWLASAGGMCTVPPLGSSVYYSRRATPSTCSAKRPSSTSPRLASRRACPAASPPFGTWPTRTPTRSPGSASPRSAESGADIQDDTADDAQEEKPASFAKPTAQAKKTAAAEAEGLSLEPERGWRSTSR
ncbi:hypothetical protein QYE76_062555 [Lolium multiflorum]|uniref:Uncharacterized protein n=1 Tax=Lolium multiflorum TaxID=4521 RepID=A0AAD8W7D1_LOLMU|nr:hypothetical protein QYE76_062555 [Lolium multiflorum]